MLADVYCVNGLEHSRYHHACKHILVRSSAGGGCPAPRQRCVPGSAGIKRLHKRCFFTRSCPLQGRGGAIGVSIFQITVRPFAAAVDGGAAERHLP